MSKLSLAERYALLLPRFDFRQWAGLIPQFGPEMLPALSAWAGGAGWSFSGGIWTGASATGLLGTGNLGLSTSSTYRLVFTIAGFTGGFVNVRLGNNGLNTLTGFNANGTYTNDIQPSNVATQDLNFNPGSFSGQITSVSLKLKRY